VTLAAADVEATRDLVLGFLTPRSGRDWSAPVPDLEWDCETTLRHMVTAQASYAAHLATRSTRRLSVLSTAAPGLGVDALLDILRAQASILADVVRGAPPEARGLHASGMTDPSGYAAMSCDELLVHTWDIGRGLGDPFALPEELCSRLVPRLFPMWLPIEADPRDAFLWCNGRIALPERPRLDGDWGWWSSPVEEWDGTDPDA